MATPLSLEFFRGNNKEVVRRTVDGSAAGVDLPDLPYVIGALSFLGRLEEAETHFRLGEPGMAEALKVAARFFLGIGWCRRSEYEKARRYFARNLRASRSLGAESRFYAFQGVGFYRFFSGRFRRALVLSTRAYEAAVEAQFPFGKALAADLRGHSQVKRGQISTGLATLELAAELTRAFDTTDPGAALAVTLGCYRAEFGMDADAVSTLQKLLQSAAQDSFSQSALLLELARQQILRGALREARATLDRALRLVYATANRRQEVVLNLLYAHVYLLGGEPQAALGLVKSGRRLLDLRVDRALEIRVLGMERKILARLGLAEGVAEIDRSLASRTRTVGEYVGSRMWARQNSAPAGGARGEDPLGDIVDKTREGREAAIAAAVESGYYGLLADALPEVASGQPVIFCDLVPGGLAFCDRDGIGVAPKVLTRTLRRILECLAGGEITKQNLIEKVWHYTYHPLRHDALVYAALAKLRKALGGRASWLEATEHGYRLSPQVKCVFRTTAREAARGATVVELRPHRTKLNLRQLEIVKQVRRRGPIDLETCRKLFPVAAITLSRDLSFLTAQRVLVRTGRGRATRYVLPEHELLEPAASRML